MICLFVTQTNATKINATFVVHANRDLLVQVSSKLFTTMVVTTMHSNIMHKLLAH